MPLELRDVSSLRSLYKLSDFLLPEKASEC